MLPFYDVYNSVQLNINMKTVCEAQNKLKIDCFEFIFCLYDMSHNLKLNTEMSNSLRQSKLLNMLHILILNIKINAFLNVRCIKKI